MRFGRQFRSCSSLNRPSGREARKPAQYINLQPVAREPERVGEASQAVRREAPKLSYARRMARATAEANSMREAGRGNDEGGR